jgi:hypothetical protein
MLIPSDIGIQDCFFTIEMAHKLERKNCSIGLAHPTISPDCFFLVPISFIRI